MKISGNQPTRLDPRLTLSAHGDFDPINTMAETLVNPLFVPIGTSPVVVTDDQGKPLTRDQITDLFVDAMSDIANPNAESKVKEIFQAELVDYDASWTLPVAETFAVQKAVEYNNAGHGKQPYPMPVPHVVDYFAKTDIIPAAKRMIGKLGDPDEFFVAVDFTYAPATLGFWFTQESSFNDFKTWVKNQTSLITSSLPSDTVALLQTFDGITLSGMTESIVLRNAPTDNNDEYSFARVIVKMLMDYVKSGTTEAGVMPFNLTELFCPTTVVFANVERHAKASSQQVDREWRMILEAIEEKPTVMSNRQIAKLTALPRAQRKARVTAASSKTNQDIDPSRVVSVKFREKPARPIDLYQQIIRALKYMGTVNKSMNIYRTKRNSFSKPNRRDPDNYNKPGVVKSINYFPDLHIYLDTSGSISEKHYRDTVVMLIQLAKKLNVNLYFNSFSHVLSQTSVLRVQGRSTAQVWQNFRAIPKVGGGTNFRQIWEFINASPKRKREMSLVITDFAWCPDNRRVEYPKNIYYAPVMNTDWDQIKYCAKKFADSMAHIDPALARHLLGVTI